MRKWLPRGTQVRKGWETFVIDIGNKNVPKLESADQTDQSLTDIEVYQRFKLLLFLFLHAVLFKRRFLHFSTPPHRQNIFFKHLLQKNNEDDDLEAEGMVQML